MSYLKVRPDDGLKTFRFDFRKLKIQKCFYKNDMWITNLWRKTQIPE